MNNKIVAEQTPSSEEEKRNGYRIGVELMEEFHKIFASLEETTQRALLTMNRIKQKELIEKHLAANPRIIKLTNELIESGDIGRISEKVYAVNDDWKDNVLARLVLDAFIKSNPKFIPAKICLHILMIIETSLEGVAINQQGDKKLFDHLEFYVLALTKEKNEKNMLSALQKLFFPKKHNALKPDIQTLKSMVFEILRKESKLMDIINLKYVKEYATDVTIRKYLEYVSYQAINHKNIEEYCVSFPQFIEEYCKNGKDFVCKEEIVEMKDDLGKKVATVMSNLRKH